MRDSERERLYYLFQESKCPMHFLDNKEILDTTDHLLANGVVVPPCKIGDEVWMIDKVFDSKKRQHKTEVCEFVVRSILVSCNSKNVWIKKFRICQVKDGKIISHQHNISFDDFGKIVFLTREEAEAKLKEGKG